MPSSPVGSASGEGQDGAPRLLQPWRGPREIGATAFLRVAPAPQGGTRTLRVAPNTPRVAPAVRCASAAGRSRSTRRRVEAQSFPRAKEGAEPGPWGQRCWGARGGPERSGMTKPLARGSKEVPWPTAAPRQPGSLRQSQTAPDQPQNAWHRRCSRTETPRDPPPKNSPHHAAWPSPASLQREAQAFHQKQGFFGKKRKMQQKRFQGLKTPSRRSLAIQGWACLFVSVADTHSHFSGRYKYRSF